MIRVTPYMHTLHYHKSLFIGRFSTITQFTGQGVEKNDNAKGQFFQTSNKLDAARNDETTGTTKPREREVKV